MLGNTCSSRMDLCADSTRDDHCDKIQSTLKPSSKIFACFSLTMFFNLDSVAKTLQTLSSFFFKGNPTNFGKVHPVSSKILLYMTLWKTNPRLICGLFFDAIHSQSMLP